MNLAQQPLTSASQFPRNSLYSAANSRSNLHSSASSHHYNLNRARSPSPTQFYLQAATLMDRKKELVFQLNSFIHRSIERGFLDKQAVRDLIIAYDAEDIFTEGEEAFYSRFKGLPGPEAIHFGRRNTRQLVVGAEEDQRRRLRARGFYRRGFGHQNNGQNPQDSKGDAEGSTETSERMRILRNRRRAGPWTRPRSNLWTAFFAAISIKIFQFNVEKKAAAAASESCDVDPELGLAS